MGGRVEDGKGEGWAQGAEPPQAARSAWRTLRCVSPWTAAAHPRRGTGGKSRTGRTCRTSRTGGAGWAAALFLRTPTPDHRTPSFPLCSLSALLCALCVRSSLSSTTTRTRTRTIRSSHASRVTRHAHPPSSSPCLRGGRVIFDALRRASRVLCWRAYVGRTRSVRDGASPRRAWGREGCQAPAGAAPVLAGVAQPSSAVRPGEAGPRQSGAEAPPFFRARRRGRERGRCALLTRHASRVTIPLFSFPRSSLGTPPGRAPFHSPRRE
jgi:hypothetical protein